MNSKKLLIADSNIPGLPTSFRINKKREVPLSPGNTLEGTVVHPYRVGYILFRNGAGDFIVFARAFEWLADTHPHIYGTIFVPGFLVDLYKLIFADRKQWNIEATEIAGCYRDDWFHPQIQLLIDPWRNGKTQFITAQGVSPLEMGFMYYACAGRDLIPPEYYNYPLIELVEEGLPKELRGQKYAVIPAGSIRNTGRVPGHFWNPVIENIKKRDLTPVLLGKSTVTEGYTSNFPTGITLAGVVNLWDKTSILEAAQIMQYGQFTIGLDNGLLHLAACTPTTVIFGHNVANVKLRSPISQKGKTIDVFLTKDELRCIGCLTDVKALYNHDFNLGCLYEKFPEHNMACVTRLFENGGERWIKAIDSALEEK